MANFRDFLSNEIRSLLILVNHAGPYLVTAMYFTYLSLRQKSIITPLKLSGGMVLYSVEKSGLETEELLLVLFSLLIAVSIT